MLSKKIFVPKCQKCFTLMRSSFLGPGSVWKVEISKEDGTIKTTAYSKNFEHKIQNIVVHL